MREIKFRAWDKEMQMICFPKAHYIVNGSVATSSQKAEAWSNQPVGEIYNPEENEHHTVFVEDERFILMQFTGLKDKNGKEIYEGDILSIEATDDDGDVIQDILVIKYQEQGFYGAENMPLWDKQIWKYEIIGNIYQNPELLK